MATATPQSLEDRILYLLAPFRPPFIYIKPSNERASVEDQLAEQREAQILARMSSLDGYAIICLAYARTENLAFLIRNGERHDYRIVSGDVLIALWGLNGWVKGTSGCFVTALVQRENMLKVLQLGVNLNENTLTKLSKQVELDLEKIYCVCPSREILLY